MKFYWIGIIAALMVTGTATAQHMNVGIKGGLNVYNVYNDDNDEADPNISFHAGLLGHVHLSDQFGLQPEIMYSVQGSQFVFGGDDVKVNLNYVNIPLLLQYMFDNGFRLQAGPQLGLLVSAKSEWNEINSDVKDDYESIDWGVAVGMSYVNPSSGFGLDARYNHGLTNIRANGSVNSYNRGFQVGVFYLFNHKS